ncbi:leucine-rich repeat-containing protein 47-like [Fopius arisanus]|uniref:Leucine-rich repeat-containing protein 47-like n=1 Tax=Fopius arisanus TaxID=64838 RepID=A0A9R1T6V7_9HYME|nr:PREDICTED: leucine-rich repeat-containing protein 47-like [Fopius arisanus]
MDVATAWSEVSQIWKENRHELVLSGAKVSQRISENGLDNNIFRLQGLNYLNISQTSLETIPQDISKLENLTTLVLHSNKISSLPRDIRALSKLKVIDCSRNQLKEVPDELSNFPQLMTINFGSNLLDHLPCQKINVKLAALDLSNNQFEVFPDVCYGELVHLAEIRVNGNKIKEIPGTLKLLPSLKLLDLADNCIKDVPRELADCVKLKELNLKGNKLNDKRLHKLVDQCRTKQVLDYVKQHGSKSENSSGQSGKNKKDKKGNKTSESETTPDAEILTHQLMVLKVSDDNRVVKILENVKSVRPHIVCCVVRNLNFTDENFKKFIQLQTKLHEGICEKRNAATLATHDLDLIVPGDLTYTAKPPKELKIMPLNRSKTYTASALFQQLQTEADNLRREKKRNVYSGVHRYLYLIEGKPVFPCLLDASDQVISLPPITNSEITKMSTNSKNMFVEVTSSTSQQICRNVMDQFLKELLPLGIATPHNNEEIPHQYHKLQIERVKGVDIEGNMKLVYPSRTDLIFDDKNVTVIRE